MENDSKRYEFDSDRAFAEGNKALGEELMLMEIDEVMLTLEKWGREDEETLAVLKAHMDGAVPADIDDDAPLTIEQALCLPELGGVFSVAPGLRSASETVKAKTLRGAVEAYRNDPQTGLRSGWLNGKNMYVTRRWVRDWMERCQDQRSRHTSSSVPPAATARAASRTSPSGTSTTTGSSTSLDAARKIVQELRERSRTTSSGSTPRK